ncbi:MAG: hypothetical protein NPINA01_01940 [Nitrospinaceae bacterium]|nr:MAG: hypothetical protein NPINA01_01940 [Nitrospinaceae bacterium]
MFKRLVDIARASLNGCIDKKSGEKFAEGAAHETSFNFAEQQENHRPEEPSDPLAQYYANLEIPAGSDREAVKSAWKRMLKKYHPDLHDADREKRKVADELTRRLTESYRILDEELSKRE